MPNNPESGSSTPTGNPAEPSKAQLSWWQDREFLFKAIMVPLLTATVTFVYGAWQNQTASLESRNRIYAELITKREQADSDLRKDMFSKIIESFVDPKAATPSQQVLHLELLSHNFHESLDLGPLFKHTKRNLKQDSKLPAEDKKELSKRLARMANEVVLRQNRVLEEAGSSKEWDFDITKLADEDAKPVELTIGNFTRVFKVEMLSYDDAAEEFLVRLKVSKPNSKDEVEHDSWFRVGWFDFPMIDNIRLSKGQRVAVVLCEIQGGFAKAKLVFFPGSRASLKEKQYYDEIIQDLLAQPGSGKH